MVEKKRAREEADEVEALLLKKLCSPAIKSLLEEEEVRPEGGPSQQQEELIRSLEEEINLSSASSSPRAAAADDEDRHLLPQCLAPAPEFSYLFEASDDELGIGFPGSPALSEADLSCSLQMPLRGNILDFLDGEVISLDFAELNRAVASSLDSVGVEGLLGFDSQPGQELLGFDSQQVQILVETPGLLL